MNEPGKNYKFFLGGNDAEMERIREVLRENGYGDFSIEDHKLGWGAKVSDYAVDESIQHHLYTKPKWGHGGFYRPVFIELELDMEIPEDAVVIDHHGDRSGEPASLLQVLKLIGKEPSRRDELIAANDSGYIPGMEMVGATQEEIQEIRALDRKAQGVTEAQEQEAVEALRGSQEVNGVTIVKLPHSKTATVADRLYQKGMMQNLLVLSGEGEVNYFGPGDICQKFADKFSGAWSGGEGLGDPLRAAFCGGYPNHAKAKEFVLALNAARPNQTIERKSAFDNGAKP